MPYQCKLLSDAPLNDQITLRCTIVHPDLPCLGESWWRKFLEKYHKVKSGFSRACKRSRLEGCLPEKVQAFYNCLFALQQRHQYVTRHISNMDETGFGLGDIQLGCAITYRKDLDGKDICGNGLQVTNARGERITLLSVFLTMGRSFPLTSPTRVPCPTEHELWQRAIRRALDQNWSFAGSSTGWTNDKMGLHWLEYDYHPLSWGRAERPIQRKLSAYNQGKTK